MSLTLNLLTFSKRENSTKVPSSAQISGGRELSVLLKDATSVYNPTFVLRTSDPHTFNYAYCPDFGKYYFIRDWVSDHDMWNCICEEDVLATFRSQIRSSSQYVLRAATRWNTNIVDALYPTNANVTFQNSAKIPIFSGFPQPGYIILEVVNSDPGASLTTYYLMSEAQFGVFKQALMGDIDWLDISSSELSKQLQKALINPVQYITDAWWIPYLPGPALTQQTYFQLQETIKIGWWELECSCYKLVHTRDGSITTISAVTWPVIKHPDSESRGQYLNLQPYTFYSFWSQTFGKIPLDSNLMIGEENLNIVIKGDFRGSVILSIETEGGHRLVYLEKSAKVPIQVGQMTQDLAGAGNSALQVGIGAVSFASGDFVGATLGMASGVSSAVQSLTPKLASSGSQGSMTAASLDTDVGGYIQCEFHYQVDEDIQDRGKPLCTRAQLSTLAASATSSGYVLCTDANIATTGTKQEDNQIISYLNGGLFIE